MRTCYSSIDIGRIKKIHLLILSLLLYSCASNVDVSQVNLNNPVAELKHLQQKMHEARQNKVAVLSPNWFKNASQNLTRAEKLSATKNTGDAFITAVASAKQYLEKAIRAAKIAIVEIKPAIRARDAAIKAQVPQTYPSEFEIAEQNFAELAGYIEQDEVSTARNETKNVRKAFQKLEVRAIKEHKMGSARKLIKQAESRGARRYVPTILKITKTMLVNTDKYITAKPHGDEVQRRTDELLNSSKHLNVALNRVKVWAKMRLEDIFIIVEDRVVSIERLASGDNQSVLAKDLDKHFHALEENVKSRLESQKFLNEEVTRLQQELKTANLEMQDLSEVKRKRQEELKFQAKFQRVREIFNMGEADIFRQGSTLLIRLKGMNFEIGKSYILLPHYPILNKVQKAIRIFETQRTVIEGHTDSTGSKAQNKVLSQQRADAVMAYLVNNGAIDRTNITAIGYGPDKPITANTTARGRKTNRRIDVVLLVDR